MSIMILALLMIEPRGGVVVVIIASIYRIILSLSGASILEEIFTVTNSNINYNRNLILAIS